MSPRSLFTIILKALGIFFSKDIVLILPTIASTFYYIKNSFEGGDPYWTIGLLILQLVFYIYISYFLLFRTEKLINLFHLDSGFEEKRFELNINANSIYTIAIIVTGLYVLINEIPTLFRTLYEFFERGRNAYGDNSPTVSFLVVSVSKILMGLLLIGERKRIAELFKSKKTETEDEEEEAVNV